MDASSGTAFTPQVEKGLNEEQLVGKTLGIILGEEEYMSNRGEIARRLNDITDLPADKIRAGEFTVPDIKKLESQTEATAASSSEPEFIPDANIPF